MSAELRNPVELARVEDVLRTDSRITLLVNSAGIGSAASILEADVDEMTDMIALNVNALMRLRYAAAPGLVARGGGTIVNISSAVAIGPEILNGVYGGTKAFVLAFSQSLHHGLAQRNVRIQAVLPGAVETAFWTAAGKPASELPAGSVMNADDLVDAALVGLDQGELVTIPSLPDLVAWKAYEGARQAMMPSLSRSRPGERYLQRPTGRLRTQAA